MPLVSLLFAAGVQAGAGHPLAQAAFGEECLFQRAKLLVQKVVRLVNHTDENIGHNLGRASLDIGPIRLIGHIGPRSDLADK